MVGLWILVIGLVLSEWLLDVGYIEERFIAFEFAYRIKKQYEEKDFKRFEGWVRKYVGTWMECDDISSHTLGYFVYTFPRYIDQLKKWARSSNRWFKRAACVSMIYSARRGQHLRDIFEIAGILLEDGDDLVQKGYGWMLKEASKKFQKQVFGFVMKNKKKMPRTPLRYAIEKMPVGMRKRAMGG